MQNVDEEIVCILFYWIFVLSFLFDFPLRVLGFKKYFIFFLCIIIFTTTLYTVHAVMLPVIALIFLIVHTHRCHLKLDFGK